MLMIEPGSFASTSRSATACATKNAARTLSPMMMSKSSTVTSTSIFGRLVPALLTRMSNGSRCRQRAPHGVDVGDVERQRVGLVAARADRRRPPPRSRPCVRAASVTCAPACGERRGRRQPDAAPAAGDQRALAVEAERGRAGEVDRHRIALNSSSSGGDDQDAVTVVDHRRWRGCGCPPVPARRRRRAATRAASSTRQSACTSQRDQPCQFDEQ